jgi:hypothetical protein
MSFDSLERSTQQGTPAELFDFVAPAKTWRLTSHEGDVTYGGNTYSAVTGSRSTIAIPDMADNQSEVTIQLPALHDLPQTYIAGITMRELLVTITRVHLPTAIGMQFWQGYASDISFSKGQASLRIPSGTNDALAMDVPSVCAQRLCNHVLYDNQCTVARAGFQLVTTIASGSSISADGKTITLAAGTPGPLSTSIDGVAVLVPWALHGELLHPASGERRTIIDQPSTTTVVLQAPFPSNVIGPLSPVTVFAGCSHDIFTCDQKFSNGVNHGGYPYLTLSNIFYTGLVTSRYR